MPRLSIPDVDFDYQGCFLVVVECFRRRDGVLDSGRGNPRRKGVLPESETESRQTGVSFRQMDESFRRKGG
jgi:hypothetical protein